jgi:hypothetical protein
MLDIYLLSELTNKINAYLNLINEFSINVYYPVELISS